MTRYWQRLPIIVRAIVIGFCVFAIGGVIAWTLVLTFIPSPWSIPVMLVILWVYWRYFRGDWWPKTTSALRQRCIRSSRLSADTWKWSLIAALAAAALLQAALVITFRIIEFPADKWRLPYDFSALPAWQIWALLVLAAVVAGVTEEIGFRGYMQVPLEKRYGPVTGIVIVSIVFVFAHLNQAWAGGIIVVVFAISIIWGVLARVSGSLIPGIISHSATDVVNFSYWWTDVAGSFDHKPISTTGIDAHFVASATVFSSLLMLFIFAASKMLAARQETRID